MTDFSGWPWPSHRNPLILDIEVKGGEVRDSKCEKDLLWWKFFFEMEVAIWQEYKWPQWLESSGQSLSRVRLFVTPWIAAHQASLSITNSWSGPWLTTSGEMNMSVPQQQRTERSQHFEWIWTWILPMQPAHHLHFSLVRKSWRENSTICAWTSDLHNYELINGYCVEFKTWHKGTYLWNRNRLTDVGNRLVVAMREEKRGRLDWEFRNSRSKLLHIGWINNKVLQNSTGNYIQ